MQNCVTFVRIIVFGSLRSRFNVLMVLRSTINFILYINININT